jgi:DNA-binding CsgD family transcriptional regulator
MENSIFFLLDENSKLTNFFGKNIEERYLREFRDYYYQYDPFKLVQGLFHGSRIIRLEELVSYSSFLNSEYYNDFLRPQRIQYKTCVYLKSGVELLGVIGLFRPKEFGNFSEKEIRMLKILAPYLSQALQNVELIRRMQVENSIFKMVDRNLSSGVIIFDDSMRLIHMNSKAKDFCKALVESDGNNNERYYAFIPYIILNDCYFLREQMKNSLSLDIIPLPIYKTLKLSDHKKYFICSQVTTKEMSSENQLFYMIKIDELFRHIALDVKTLENDFSLTGRELDILVNIFSGAKNAEIAEKLFISEITVKKHLQHVFEKMRVNSRGALIRKLVDYQCTRPQGVDRS